MTTYEDLRDQFRRLTKKAQRIQHQTKMMRRRLPIARKALETVASGDHAPEILRIAREALKELNVSAVPAEEQCLYLVADTPTPPVDVTDLSRYRELLESLAVMGENPSNHVLVDGDVERQGHLLCDSRTAPVGITLLHFNDRMNEFCARSLRAGLPTAIRGEQHAILLLAHGFVKA